MPIRRVTGFCFLLSVHCAAASEASLLLQDNYADTGDPNTNPNPDALDIVDSGFQDSAPDIVPDHYPYDIFWQSGGVRVRAESLNQEGQKIYQHFLHHERQEQRAFIWCKLHLENINFVHLGTENPMIQPAQAKDTTEKGMSEVLDLEFWGFDTPEAMHTLPQSAADVLPKLLDDVDWNLNAVHVFVKEGLFAPLYNDMPSASGDSAASRAYNDPRYRNSDAVVNYRANLRTLLMESLHLLGKTAEEESGGLLPEGNKIIKEQLNALRVSCDERRSLISQKIREIDRRAFDIDINVDALTSDVPLSAVYLEITKGIEAHIEKTHNGLESVDDAMRELQQIADEETARANRYTAFNNPGMRDMPDLRVGRERRLSDNINDVYTRATVRRKELHEMTEPFIGSTEFAPTYRVHFADPEHRFCESCTGVASHPKEYYQAIWTRLLEPALRDVLVDGLPNPTLRNIVLIDNELSMDTTFAYVYMEKHLIVHCDLVNTDHRQAVRVIKHEYEHIVDASMGRPAEKRYAKMESKWDLSTLSLETIENEIRMNSEANQPDMHRLTALKTEQEEINKQLSTNRFSTFNVDGISGFPNYYARNSIDETLAEQRYAMRKEPLRIAFLRRMSLIAVPAQPNTKGWLRLLDAERRQKFYDIARNEMKSVAPDLYKQWGENYDGRNPLQWGLFPGETVKTDKCYQIMALDHTIATNTASEKIAAKLLARGYDVSMTTHRAGELSRSIPVLQSNMEEPFRGQHYPSLEVHAVAQRTISGKAIASEVFTYFRYFTPMGRTNIDRSIDQFNLKTVTIVRAPKQPFHASVETNEEVQHAFAEEWIRKRGHDAAPRPSIVVHDGHVDVTHDGRIDSAEPAESVWVRNSNDYRDTIFGEWIDSSTGKVLKPVKHMECYEVA